MLCFMLLQAGCIEKKPKKFTSEFAGPFDTYMIITGYALNEEKFNDTAEKISSKMQRLNNILDVYNDYSDLNNIKTVNDNAGLAPVKVPHELVDMLTYGKLAYEITNGSVNIALGPVTRLWRDFRDKALLDPMSAKLPTKEELEKAGKLCDINYVIINAKNDTVYLAKKGMSLDIEAIAKGYAAKQAKEYAVRYGLSAAVIDIGGNIVTFGRPDKNNEKFRIGIANSDITSEPVYDIVNVRDCSIVTNGGNKQFYEVNGVRYNFLIDPVTLMPASGYSSVTVVSNDPAISDILSAALFILSPEKGDEIADRYGAAVIRIFPDFSVLVNENYTLVSDKFAKTPETGQ